MSFPLISVITVVYNARHTLEATIQSVLNQDKALFEYWIVDGGSTDGSIEIIRKYEHQLAGWCSEADKGIYDAMNKGIDRANGEWIYFLGGDDTLRSGIFEQIRSHLNAQHYIVFGDVVFDNGYRFCSFFGSRTILQNTVHHQSAFYNASVFANFRYDSTLKIVSDYDMHLRLYMQKVSICYVPLVIADCATGGASSQLSTSLKETNQVRSRYVKNKLKNKFLAIFLTLYYAQKRVRYLLYKHRV